LVVTQCSKTCKPTIQSDFGPIYTLTAPYKKEICPSNAFKTVYQASANHPLIWREELAVNRSSTNIRLRGRVLSSKDCTPLIGAEIDIWQCDSHGSYGGMHPLADPSYCRALQNTSSDGTYEFISQEPGSYGSSRVFFGSNLIPDFPPYGPRHIHVLVFHPTHRLLVTQIYFKGDPAREYDWRKLGGILLNLEDKLESTNEELAIDPIKADGVVYFDFVLEPLEKGVNQPSTRIGTVMEICNGNEPIKPIAVCYPNILWIFSFPVFYAVNGVIFGCFIWYVRRLIKPKRKTTPNSTIKPL